MRKKYKDDPQEISLKYLREILDIVGLIETKGKFFKPKYEQNNKITEMEIEDILFQVQDYHEKEDWGRTIKTAKKIFNSSCKNFEMKGSRSGTIIRSKNPNVVDDNIVQDLGYQTLMILALALMNTNNSLNIDFLNQLLSQKKPLGLILFLSYAIENKLVVTFQYKSNRAVSSSRIDKFVPVKINFRDGHWLLIGWDITKSHWNQYLFHSILEIEPVYEIGNKDLYYYNELPKFDIDEFYKCSFGIAVLKDIQPIEIHIQVPLDKVEAIQKRRRDGEWIKLEEQEDYMLWKVGLLIFLFFIK